MADADEAVRRAGDFTLVVVDAVDPPRTGVEVCAEIRRTPALAGIPVLCVCQEDDVEERVRFLEAGADDVIARPFDPRELEARIEGLLIRFQRSRDLAPMTGGDVPVAGRRHLIACFSPKGGVGTTTIAVNVATVLAHQLPNQVLILDLDVDFGQVATHLNVNRGSPPSGTWRPTRPGRTRRTCCGATRSAWSPAFMSSPPPRPPSSAARSRPSRSYAIMTTAPHAYQVMIVDVGSTLDERSLAVLGLGPTR